MRPQSDPQSDPPTACRQSKRLKFAAFSGQTVVGAFQRVVEGGARQVLDVGQRVTRRVPATAQTRHQADIDPGAGGRIGGVSVPEPPSR